MKNIIILALVGLFAIPTFSQESKVSEEKNVFKVNTLSLIVGTGSVFYERKFTENVSGQLGVAYLNFGTKDTRFSGLILTPEVRFYPKKDAIDGFYLAPYVRYQNFGLKNDDDKATYSNIGGGFAVGRQWITGSGFTMDLFFGGHYGSGKIDVDPGDEDSFSTEIFDGFGTRVGFAIGFAF
ncbi:MAG: DUF3575 domain-containing protein [Bacteroidales bacterium]|nr:DUF3575 domain-containing protein [Tenuifilaceae bacterium]